MKLRLQRVIRGANCENISFICSSSERGKSFPFWKDNIGLRIVMRIKNEDR